VVICDGQGLFEAVREPLRLELIEAAPQHLTVHGIHRGSTMPLLADTPVSGVRRRGRSSTSGGSRTASSWSTGRAATTWAYSSKYATDPYVRVPGRSLDHRSFADLAAEIATEVRLGRAVQTELAAHATEREACNVKQRWETGAVDRTTARAADRKRRQVTDWWTARERRPSTRNARHPRRPRPRDPRSSRTTPQHRQPTAIDHERCAASSVNWRTDGAAYRFLQRLSRISTENPVQHAAHGRTATHEQ
jgi:hypothetical protein